MNNGPVRQEAKSPAGGSPKKVVHLTAGSSGAQELALPDPNAAAQSPPPTTKKVVQITAVEQSDHYFQEEHNAEEQPPNSPSPPSAAAAATNGSPVAKKKISIMAVEEESEFQEEHDIIPGPPADHKGSERDHASNSGSQRRGSNIFKRVLGASSSSGARHARKMSSSGGDPLQLSFSEHQWSGQGILASRNDLDLPADEFAAGSNLLQQAALGNQAGMEALLNLRPHHVNFRDYDRRTALHVAASEGHLHICKYLVDEKGAKLNRSDRWGGSPLDDAHRHRHRQVIVYLRDKGASTGSGNRLTNLIKAAADGDLDEVQMILRQSGSEGENKLDINKGDYDKRTALHLAAGEGHDEIVKVLCEAGADVNVEDRWLSRPLDDAMRGKHEECIKLLKSYGAQPTIRKIESKESLDTSSKRLMDNLKIDFEELEMIDRIGAGAFGEIYKCRWRGTLAAAKIIKSAKIRKEWVNKRVMEEVQKGKDIDEAIRELDMAEMEEDEKDLALADFRQEISVLKSLRHPNIVLLLAYSTTENYEVMVSELAKCSLLDIMKFHIVQGSRMPHRTQIVYGQQLAQGMLYLHTSKPPIIHRDLKPANLLIDFSGTLKISDFGLSKVRETKTGDTDTFIMTGETGSYRFMAPEVYRHEQYNETVDIYSYAMIFFYLLVGRPPWPNLSGLAAVRKASEEGDRPTIPRDLDARLQTLLKECWNDDPSLRPDFNHILRTLAAYQHDVFRQDSNAVMTPTEVDTECACAIL